MDDTDTKPCWYNNGVWHDADNKPVEKNKEEYIDTIKSLEYAKIADDIEEFLNLQLI